MSDFKPLSCIGLQAERHRMKIKSHKWHVFNCTANIMSLLNQKWDETIGILSIFSSSYIFRLCTNTTKPRLSFIF